MGRLTLTLFSAGILVGAFALHAPKASAAPAAAPAEQFELKIRPLLANRCFACHSSTALGGLTMTSREALLRGGKSGPALVPGKPEESLIIRAVEHTDDRMKMPMGAAKLSDGEIALLSEWVRTGAFWPETAKVAAAPRGKYVITPEQRAFWAFQTPKKPALPEVTDAAWSRNSIDRFVWQRLEEKHLTPNAPAERRDLIRRAYLDLTGLPPTFAETEAFARDQAPDAYAKLIDRLLASPRYGERWGRYWLDVARYADDRLDSDVELPYPNSFRYRDWVIQAFNEDMPYDRFVKEQVGGEGTGLGFYGLSPELTDDRVDVTTRGFLALTGACAQCHDHKFDPIPTKDYYALQGVFSSTKRAELALAPADEVKRYKEQKQRVDEVKTRIEQFLHHQADELAEMLASDSPRYIRAVRRMEADSKLTAKDAASADHLDAETLERWAKYLKTGPTDNKYLHGWREESFDLAKFRHEALAVLQERKMVDEKNARNAVTNDAKTKGETFALPPDRFYLWRDLFFNDFYGREFKQEEDGILWYGPNRGYLSGDGTVDRFLEGRWKTYLADLRGELKELQQAMPPQYAFAHVIQDLPAPRNEHIQIGGVPENLGEEAPRAFLSILSKGDPVPFREGSGRRELAEAIANPENPLTARVMVNRVWQHHFGEGLVRTVSNFGRMGETPSHPELLDYLATSFVENGWSLKKLHREIMLSETYRLSSANNPANFSADPDNRLLWRANRQRLDAEAMRDELLAVSGELDPAAGGTPAPLGDLANHKRSVYGFVSRRKLDGTLALFDFPNPNLTAEKRISTATPLQQLFFLNSSFVEARADALTRQVGMLGTPEEHIRKAYQLVFAREPKPEELAIGTAFLAQKPGAFRPYAQVLLSSNELLFVN